MDALDYVQTLRIAPNGERLNTSQKLTLILLVLTMGDDGLCAPSKDALADQALVNTRSVKRILAELETMRLILPMAQYTEQGQDAPTKYLILDAKGESVARNTLQSGRVLRMTPGECYGTREGVTGNTLADANKISNLAPPVSGTRLAIIPPPPQIESNNGEGEVLSPASQVWAEMMRPHGLGITPAIAALIDRKPPLNLEAWRHTLEGWLASGWKANNIDGQLERYYKKTLSMPEYAKQGNAPPPSPIVKTEAEAEEEELFRRTIYGDRK